MSVANSYTTVKIPPRTVFAAQLFAVVWLSFVQIAAYNFLRGNIEGICTTDQPNGLTCPYARTFYNASVIWGVLGPAKMFGAGQLFSWVNWFWLIGAVLPVIQYFLALRYPRSFLRYVFFPAIFGAAGMIPPATFWYLVSKPQPRPAWYKMLTRGINRVLGCWSASSLTTGSRTAGSDGGVSSQIHIPSRIPQAVLTDDHQVATTTFSPVRWTSVPRSALLSLPWLWVSATPPSRIGGGLWSGRTTSTMMERL